MRIKTNNCIWGYLNKGFFSLDIKGKLNYRMLAAQAPEPFLPNPPGLSVRG
jgi:hypothetical protein